MHPLTWGTLQLIDITEGFPMRGKIGLVVGLGVGYVLGTRAGRARYEQIKKQAEKVWELEPVQKQVGKAKDFAQTSALAVPRVAWDGVVKVIATVAEKQGTPGQKLDSAIDEVEDAVDDVKKAAD
ncbi:YhcB family protein [Microbacterium sp. G2-8]|uniref:YhcB family protein n=1 Tax=Microbacterium sp. G2-8 TaxID=2842454 RepID=UPI001C894485|nr:YhcB family protein [Microbacterium sp. G2-8]